MFNRKKKTVNKQKLIQELQEWRDRAEADADEAADPDDVIFHTGMADGFMYVIVKLEEVT
jgi:hypothetical protein